MSADELPMNGYHPIKSIRDPDVVALTLDMVREFPYSETPGATVNRRAVVVIESAWLAEHDRAVKEAAWDEGWEAGNFYAIDDFNRGGKSTNPYRSPSVGSVA